MDNRYNKNTFRELLEEYRIVIPIIQREYAQGRNTPRARKVRKEFIKTIKKHLKENNPLHLDFIFGVVENSEGNSDKEKILIPIDGQQRLTLLFLLHYYLGIRAGIDKEDMKYLKNFTYEVRDSSKDFIKSLIDETGWNSEIRNLNCDEKEGAHKQKSLSHWIQNRLWFLPGWEKDPTINSMLTVLDEIHRKFKEETDFKRLYNNLDSITFEFMKMEDYSLDEELYIKLNSTGRQLTELEIFKAEFQKFLDELGDDFKEKVKNFRRKMDSDWLDIFWENFKYEIKYEKDEYFSVDATMINFFYYMIEMLLFEILEPPDKSKKEDKQEDSLSERFYGGDRWWDQIYLWEIFKAIKSDRNKREIFKNWFDTLFYALDNLNGIHKLCDDVFHSGSLVKITPNDWEKVAIWTDNPNLLERVIFNYRYRFASDRNADFKPSSIYSEGFKKKTFNQLNLAEKMLLYTLIKYHNRENLHDILRLARNMIWSVNKTSSIEQRLGLSGRNVHYVLKLLERLIVDDKIHFLEEEKLNIKFERDYLNIPKERYKHERMKQDLTEQNPNIRSYIYALENHPYLKGDLRIFLYKVNIEDIINNLGDYTRIFYEIFKQDDTKDNKKDNTNDGKIIPALISVALEKDKDGELSMFNYSNDGEKKFFGYKNYWGYLLHSLPGDRLKGLKPIWIEFLKRIKERCSGDCVGENVKTDEYTCRNRNIKDWRYYYIKYEEFYEDFRKFGVSTEYNIFFIPKKNEKENLNWFFAEKLKKERALGHHLNPFLYVICNELGKKGYNCTTKSESDGIILHSGWDRRGEDFDSYLELKNNDIDIKIWIRTRWDDHEKDFVAEGWRMVIDKGEQIIRDRIKRINKDKDNTWLLEIQDKKDLIETLVEFIEKIFEKPRSNK